MVLPAAGVDAFLDGFPCVGSTSYDHHGSYVCNFLSLHLFLCFFGLLLGYCNRILSPHMNFAMSDSFSFIYCEIKVHPR